MKIEMSHQEYLKAFESILKDMLMLTEKKNHDYAGGKSDAFANFRQIADLTQERISVEDGILVRMTDKMSRISNLIASNVNPKVQESVLDTLQDLAVYSIILYIYLMKKQTQSQEKGYYENAAGTAQETRDIPLRDGWRG